MGRFSALVVLLFAIAACREEKKELHVEVSPPDSGAPSAAASEPAPAALAVRAAKLIAACKSPPPRECSTDADCDTFGIPTFDGPCPSTLRVGIRAARKAEYLAGSPCPGEARSNVPSCVVHWDHAEDAPDQPSAGSEIAARCVKSASGQNSCVARRAPKKP